MFNVATMTEPINAKDAAVTTTCLVDALPIMEGQLSQKWDEEVIIPMGGDVQNVARAALKNLHSNVLHRARDVARVCHMTHAITLINYLSTYKPICDAFVAQHSIRALVKAMDSLSPPLTHGDFLECTTLCITSACICIRTHIFANDGLSGIIDAFSSGIFPALMRCADLLDHDEDNYFRLLSHSLPKFIIYPSVFRALRKSLAAFGEDSRQISSMVQSPTLKKAWEVYTQLTVSMEGIMLIRETAVGLGQEVCANHEVSLTCYVILFGRASHRDTQCNKSDLRTALRLCSGCRDAYYCSSACQRADWKKSHRAQCNTRSGK